MIRDTSRAAVRLGASVFPNVTGRQNPVFSAGWSETDPSGFVWIDGAAGECVFDLPPVLGELTLEVDCFPVEITAPAPQRVILFGNGLFAGAQLLRQRAVLSFHIGREIATARHLRLALLPGMIEVPKLAGRNSDERALSVGVFSLCLRAATPT